MVFMRVSSPNQRHGDYWFWDEVRRHVNTFKIIPVFRVLPVLRRVGLEKNVWGWVGQTVEELSEKLVFRTEASLVDFRFRSSHNGRVVAMRFI